MNWEWVQDNQDLIKELLVSHIVQSLVPVIAALIVSGPIGYLAWRAGRVVASVVLAILGVVCSVPSLALFVILPILLGTEIVDPLNVMIAIAIYCTALLVRSAIQGFASVPDEVRSSAVAMGYAPLRRVWTVEMPVAAPVMVAGLRIATVSSIALVSVGVIIGEGALGRLFEQGFAVGNFAPIVVGLVGSVLLALIADRLIALVQRVAAPWVKRRRVA